MRRLLAAVMFIASLSAYGADEGLRVVASVADIRAESASRRTGVHIDFVIHTPADFAGLSFVVVEEGGTRKSMRSEYPLGSIFEVRLPQSASDALRKAKRDQDHVQRQIDDGTPREMISQIVIAPQFTTAELLERPRPSDAR